MNPLRRLLSRLFTSLAASRIRLAEPVVLAPESQPRPFSADELRAIDDIVGDMRGLRPRVQPCSPAPTYAEAVEEVRRERLAAGPLDTRAADLAIDAVQKAARRPPRQATKTAPIARKTALRKLAR